MSTRGLRGEGPRKGAVCRAPLRTFVQAGKNACHAAGPRTVCLGVWLEAAAPTMSGVSLVREPNRTKQPVFRSIEALTTISGMVSHGIIPITISSPVAAAHALFASDSRSNNFLLVFSSLL